MKTRMLFQAAGVLIGLTVPAALGFAETPSTASTDVHARYVAALAELHNAGIPTSYAELFPSAPPADRNAALIYIKLSDTSAYPVTPAEGEALAVLQPSPTPDDWRNAKSFLSTHADLAAMARQAASMPDCVAPNRSAAKNPLDIAFPEFSPMRRCARILEVEGMVLAHEGQYQDAIQNAALGFKVSDHAYGTPNLIGWLVGAAIDAITIRNIEQIMAMSSGDPSVIAAANQALSTWSVHPVDIALADEAVCGLTELEFLRGLGPGQLNQAIGDDRSNQFRDLPTSPAAWNAYIDANGITMARYYKEEVADASEPYLSATPKLQAMEAALVHQTGSDTAIARALMPAYAQARSKQADIEALAAIARAGAALFAYRSAHGSYPGSLDQAMADVPIDPYDLKPIGYRPDGAGFVLYSVGKTGQYAGGTPAGFESVLRVSGDGTVAWK